MLATYPLGIPTEPTNGRQACQELMRSAMSDRISNITAIDR